jgi:hypothetical protein
MGPQGAPHRQHSKTPGHNPAGGEAEKHFRGGGCPPNMGGLPAADIYILFHPITANMNNTVFSEIKFWLLVIFSVVLPLGIYAMLLARRAVSRTTVLLLGFALVVISGVDVYLLQCLTTDAKLTPSLADDTIFVSEVSLALYLLPVMFGGIGINLVSQILVNHLAEAEKKYQKK